MLVSPFYFGVQVKSTHVYYPAFSEPFILGICLVFFNPFILFALFVVRRKYGIFYNIFGLSQTLFDFKIFVTFEDIFLHSSDFPCVYFGLWVSWWLDLRIQRFNHEISWSTVSCGTILRLHVRSNNQLQWCSPLRFPISHIFLFPFCSLWW